MQTHAFLFSKYSTEKYKFRHLSSRHFTSSKGHPAETRSVWLCNRSNLSNLFLTSAAGLGGGGLDLYTWIFRVATDVNSARISPTVSSGPSATFSIGRGFQFRITMLPLALGIRSLEYPRRTSASPTKSCQRKNKAYYRCCPDVSSYPNVITISVKEILSFLKTSWFIRIV